MHDPQIPHREVFWQISYSWVFYLLAAISIGLFAMGLARRVRGWRAGGRCPAPSSIGAAVSRLLLDGLLGRRLFRGGELGAALAHTLIAWGFVLLFLGTVLSTIDHYGGAFLRGGVYQVYAVVLDAAGLMLLVGLTWALGRRFLLRVPRLERRASDLGVPLLLFASGLSGFLVEGLRLAAEEPPWAAMSFVGQAMAGLWGRGLEVLPAYQVLWWVHAGVSLAVIALFPYTRLLHVLAAPLHFVLTDPGGRTDLRQPEQEQPLWTFGERVEQDACTRCGRCEAVCPAAAAGEPFGPREFIQVGRKAASVVSHEKQASSPTAVGHAEVPLPEQTPQSSGPDRWAWYQTAGLFHCTTCHACVEACPTSIHPPRALLRLRARLVEKGIGLPVQMQRTLENLYKYQNPWEPSKKSKTGLARELALPLMTAAGPEAPAPEGLLYFIGCTTSVETRAQGMARALTALLASAEVPLFSLGKKEPCCGHIAATLGEHGLRDEQTEACRSLLGEQGSRELFTSSPHCFHTLGESLSATDEAGPGPWPQVRHYTQVLADLLDRGRLRPGRPIPGVAVFHDPCYLARHHGLVQEPRRVLRAVPGLTVREMAHHGQDTLCCGGGGGRMWQPEIEAAASVELGERAPVADSGEPVRSPGGEPRTRPKTMAERRLAEAVAVGATLLVTACPLCLIMLEDALRGLQGPRTLRVVDLAELLHESL